MKTQLNMLQYPVSDRSKINVNVPTMKINIEQEMFAVVGKGYFIPYISNATKMEKTICESVDGLCINYDY